MSAERKCSNCSASEFLAERVDAYKSATSLLKDAGVEFTPEPVERYGAVDASFRDPSGNGWKLIEAR